MLRFFKLFRHFKVPSIRRKLQAAFNWKLSLIPAACAPLLEYRKENSDERINLVHQEIYHENNTRIPLLEIYCVSCKKPCKKGSGLNEKDYCKCHETFSDPSNWVAFLEKDNLKIWRKRHEDHSNLYIYKVYGRYSDVTLNAFLEAQLNTDYRKEWDNTVLDLKVLDSEPNSNFDIIYWLVKYPAFFSDREYIFKRRYWKDENIHEAIILNEIYSDFNYTQQNGAHTVEDYWSVMVIKSLKNTHEAGIEYTLTYFDNPGTSLPDRITNFIASSGLPNYLDNLHKATIVLQENFTKNPRLPETIILDQNVSKIDKYNDSSEKEAHTSANDCSSCDHHIIPIEKKHSFKLYVPDVFVYIPFKKKCILFNLLEALEVVSPVNYGTCDELVSLDNSFSKKLLSKKIKALKNLTENFKEGATKKRSDSFEQMEEVQLRSYRYSLHYREETYTALIDKFFILMKEIIELEGNIKKQENVQSSFRYSNSQLLIDYMDRSSNNLCSLNYFYKHMLPVPYPSSFPLISLLTEKNSGLWDSPFYNSSHVYGDKEDSESCKSSVAKESNDPRSVPSFTWWAFHSPCINVNRDAFIFCSSDHLIKE